MDTENETASSKPRDSAFQELGFINATLLYVSDAKLPLCDLDAIMVQASESNLSRRLSGLLCFDGTQFLQYVEGPEKAVHDLYRRLRADPRHANMETLMLARTSDLLRFPTWSMAYVECPGERYTVASLRGRKSADALRAFELFVERVRLPQ